MPLLNYTHTQNVVMIHVNHAWFSVYEWEKQYLHIKRYILIQTCTDSSDEWMNEWTNAREMGIEVMMRFFLLSLFMLCIVLWTEWSSVCFLCVCMCLCIQTKEFNTFISICGKWWCACVNVVWLLQINVRSYFISNKIHSVTHLLPVASPFSKWNWILLATGYVCIQICYFSFLRCTNRFI